MSWLRKVAEKFRRGPEARREALERMNIAIVRSEDVTWRVSTIINAYEFIWRKEGEMEVPMPDGGKMKVKVTADPRDRVRASDILIRANLPWLRGGNRPAAARAIELWSKMVERFCADADMLLHGESEEERRKTLLKLLDNFARRNIMPRGARLLAATFESADVAESFVAMIQAPQQVMSQGTPFTPTATLQGPAPKPERAPIFDSKVERPGWKDERSEGSG